MGGSAAKGGKARPRKGGLMDARLYDRHLGIEQLKQGPPYSTIRFLRGGQRAWIAQIAIVNESGVENLVAALVLEGGMKIEPDHPDNRLVADGLGDQRHAFRSKTRTQFDGGYALFH